MYEQPPAINLACILLAGPLLIYVGLQRPVQEWPYYILYALGVVLTIAFACLLGRDAIRKTLHLPRTAFFLFHILVAGPLLLYVGVVAIHMNGHANIAPVAYTLLILLGIAAIIFHTFRLGKSVTRDFRFSE